MAESLRRGVGADGPANLTVVMPAGARDHYVAAPGSDPVLRPPGAGLENEILEGAAISVDLPDELLGADAAARGARALAGLAAAMLAILDDAGRRHDR